MPHFDTNLYISVQNVNFTLQYLYRSWRSKIIRSGFSTILETKPSALRQEQELPRGIFPLTSSTNGTAWVNAANAAKPLASTQIQTVGATRYYNVSDERDPVRQVYTDAGTAGDTSQKSRYSEYKLIDGSAPTMVTYGGAIKQSELFRVRNISLNENSIVLPSANGSFEAAAISLNYEGTRVKSALIGRDLNPMGRGDGVYYFAGAMRVSAILPNFGSNHHSGTGNSANNCGQKGSESNYPQGDGSCNGNPMTENEKHWENRTGKKLPPGNNPQDWLKAAPVCGACCPELSACCMKTSPTGDAIPNRRCSSLDASGNCTEVDCCNPYDCGTDQNGRKIQPTYGPNCPPKNCSKEILERIDKKYYNSFNQCWDDYLDYLDSIRSAESRRDNSDTWNSLLKFLLFGRTSHQVLVNKYKWSTSKGGIIECLRQIIVAHEDFIFYVQRVDAWNKLGRCLGNAYQEWYDDRVAAKCPPPPEKEKFQWKTPMSREEFIKGRTPACGNTDLTLMFLHMEFINIDFDEGFHLASALGGLIM